jgi:hypothetical protein
MDMVIINSFVTVLYYLITAFFFLAVLRNFLSTKNIQEALLYGIIMIPFVLRILRLK